ncbi:hypothetical protein [Eupransor demetentiae]|uniref:Uncharacterized protein n=1 Tax=Eupransor demetentiae TaxID=3109584 RepID=A0ABM9N6V0_9LACO|nr:hypothetical protein R54876_GBNLAHCA_01511 [Lactobacillaceae bacterium LMG 33000]
MYNQYLLNKKLEESSISELKEYVSKLELKPVKNSEQHFILTLEVDGRRDIAAKKLDEANEYIKKNIQDSLILTSESSKYFNQRLYPHINDMERKLRKLLYLANTISEGDVLIGQRLEKMDLGKLYHFLFESAFVSDVKTIVRELSTKEELTKADVLSLINEVDDVVIWDELLPSEAVPTLRNNFQQAQNYRNDVMHAHNISYKMFRSALKLYKNINAELDSEYDELLTSTDHVSTDANNIMSRGLASMDVNALFRSSNSAVAAVLKSNLSALTKISGSNMQNPYIKSLQASLRRIVDANNSAYMMNENVKRMSENIKRMSGVLPGYSEYIASMLKPFSNTDLADIYQSALDSSKVIDQVEESDDLDDSNGPVNIDHLFEDNDDGEY